MTPWACGSCSSVHLGGIHILSVLPGSLPALKTSLSGGGVGGLVHSSLAPAEFFPNFADFIPILPQFAQIRTEFCPKFARIISLDIHYVWGGGGGGIRVRYPLP